jgi:hypothetical protein
LTIICMIPGVIRYSMYSVGLWRSPAVNCIAGLVIKGGMVGFQTFSENPG